MRPSPGTAPNHPPPRPLPRSRAILLAVIHLSAAPPLLSAPPGALPLEQAVIRGLNNSQEWQCLHRESALAIRNNSSDIRQRFPQVSLSLSNRDTVVSRGPDSRSKKLQFTLDQPLYSGGRPGIKREIQWREQIGREGQIGQKRREILYTVEDLYFRLAALRKQVQRLRQTAGMTRDHLRIAQKEANLGILREADLLEIQIRHQQTVLRLTRKEEEAFQGETELLRYLGMPSGTPPILTTPLPSPPQAMADYPSPEYLRLQILKDNPSLQAARRAWQMAEAQFRLSCRRLRPSLSGRLSAGVSGESYPLTDPTLSLTLILEFPAGPLPLTVSGSTGRPGDNRRSRSLSAEASLFPAPAGASRDQSLRLAMERAEHQHGEIRQDLLQRLPRLRRAYCILLREQGILEKQLRLQNQKTRILLTKLLQGRVTRLHYIEALTEETDLRLQQDALRQKQRQNLRQLRRLCGSAPGEALP